MNTDLIRVTLNEEGTPEVQYLVAFAHLQPQDVLAIMEAAGQELTMAAENVRRCLEDGKRPPWVVVTPGSPDQN